MPDYTDTNVVVPSSVLYTPPSVTTASYTPVSATLTSDWWFDTSGNASTSNMIWTHWNTHYTSITSPTAYVRREYTPPPQPRVPDRGTLRMQEIETARSRAEDLLREHLSERQKLDLSQKGYFEVCAVNFKEGSRRYYRIYRGRAGNVFLLDGPQGQKVKKLCCHPLERVPDADTMLAQKLMIEMNEDLFLKTANITDFRTGDVIVGQGLQATG